MTCQRATRIETRVCVDRRGLRVAPKIAIWQSTSIAKPPSGGSARRFVATAHHILVIAYCVLRDQTFSRELGGDYFDRLHPQRTRNRLVRCLERVGLRVILQPRVLDAPAAPALPKRRRGRPCKCA
jgi:hypothetical protein